MEENTPIPPAVSSLLSTPSSSQSVLFGLEPPTDNENDPRAATSLSLPWVKKLLGLVSAVAPAVSVASCTKSRPFSGSCATSCDVITWPREGLAVSTATAAPDTVTVVTTVAGVSVKSSSRASSTCSTRSLVSVLWKPVASTRTLYVPYGNRGTS